MKNQKQNKKDQILDRLLTGTLRNDLPPEVESRMESQLLPFQTKLATQRQVPWYQGMLPKAALTVAALLMLVVGGYLQATGPQTQLTENIALVGTSLRVSNQVENSASMLCSVRLQRENGETIVYAIRWLSPGLIRVDVRTKEHAISQSIWIKETEISVVDFTKDSLQTFEHLEQLNDPFIPALLALLSPENLSEFLHGEWQLQNRRQKGECEWTTYAITSPQPKDAMEMTVDLCTHLPTEAQKLNPYPLESLQGEKAELRIKFQWNAPIQPQAMDPTAKKIKKNV